MPFIRICRQHQEAQALTIETLSLPDDLKNEDGVEVLRVYELLSNFELRIEWADVLDTPKEWGAFLGDVAREIAHLIAAGNGMTPEQAEAELWQAFDDGDGYGRGTSAPALKIVS